MYSREWSLRIRDILSAIESIQRYTEGMTQDVVNLLVYSGKL